MTRSFESSGTRYLIITQIQPFLYHTIFSRKSHGVTDFIIKKTKNIRKHKETTGSCDPL